MTTAPSTPGLAPRLRTFAQGDRVLVVEALHAENSDAVVPINALGTVTRVCTDGRGWIDLDKRSKMNVHPFPADDPRAAKILAWPSDCEAPTKAGKNRKEKRSAAKREAEAAKPAPTIASFGRDHWSTFGYIETRCVDYRGVPDKVHMRCHWREWVLQGRTK